MLALAPNALGPDIRPISADEAGWPAAAPRSPHAFLRSIGPALDHAFGREDLVFAPQVILALVARLQAGPLGRSADAVPGRAAPDATVPA